MRSLVFTGLTLPLTATLAFAQTTPPLVPAPPLSPLPTTPVAVPTQAPPTQGTTTTGTNVPPTDYPGAIWTPAADGNFDYEERPTQEPIDMIVVHDIEGPETAGINIFQTKGKNVSSHYIVGGDGKVYQLVREHNVAWHAGNRKINHRAIGIETHGYAYRAGWYNFTIYEAEARLIRDITTRYNIPRDRTHIIGHFEVPSPNDPTKFGGAGGHTDPGPFWDWDSFMTLIRNDAKVVNTTVPPVIHPGEALPVTVTLQNTGDDPWYANTAPSIYNITSNGPIAYLSTVGEKPSPLFISKSANNSKGEPSELMVDLRGWVSPLVAASPTTADVAPGSQVTFSFLIKGPRQLGPTTEPMRMSLFPKMVQGGRPVSFGDTLNLTTTVQPWDITLPTPDALPTTAPDAVTAPAPGTAPMTPPLTASPVATWTTKLPIGGLYALYVSPPKPTKAKKDDVYLYSFSTSDGKTDVSVKTKDVRSTPYFLGYYSFPEPTKTSALSVALLGPTGRGLSAANGGSIRLVGPFPSAPLTPVLDKSVTVGVNGVAK